MNITSQIYSMWSRCSVLRNIEWFLTKALLALWFPKGGIVIGGCGRSGTTLLIGILSAHSKICTIKVETGNLSPHIDPAMIIKWLYLSRCNTSQSAWWCEKSPKNILNVPEILSFLGPSGKFLHIVRDGRDVVTSKHPTNSNSYWVSIDRWVNDVSAGLSAEKFAQVKRVYYENLVREPRDTITEIIEFVGEEFEESMLAWEKTGKIKSHLALVGQAQGLHWRSVGRWKNPEHSKIIDEFMSREDTKALLSHLNYL
jgi:hypothetical protein